jgi:hypothetical protein
MTELSMPLSQYRLTCEAHGHRYKVGTYHGSDWLLLYSASGIHRAAVPTVDNLAANELRKRVDGLRLDRHFPSYEIDKGRRRALAALYDPAADGSPLVPGLPGCPTCGSSIGSWAETDPLEVVTESVFVATHHGWDAMADHHRQLFVIGVMHDALALE